MDETMRDRLIEVERERDELRRQCDQLTAQLKDAHDNTQYNAGSCDGCVHSHDDCCTADNPCVRLGLTDQYKKRSSGLHIKLETLLRAKVIYGTDHASVEIPRELAEIIAGRSLDVGESVDV